MDVAYALAQEASITVHDVAYLPKPNYTQVVLCGEVAPRLFTATSFMLPFLADGTMMMACNRRRGLEIPGGHIDPGEQAEDAARRETVEETGCYVDAFQALGFLRMISSAPVPPGWKYPHPVGFQQFYTGLVARMQPYADNDECLQPVPVSPEQAADPAGPLNPGQRVFWAAAYQKLFGTRPDFDERGLLSSGPVP